MKRNEDLLKEAVNLGPLVAAAKDAADCDHRPGDWALFHAVENFLQAAAEFFGADDAAPIEGVTPPVPPAPPASAPAPKHRHSYSRDGGLCLIEVDGKICGAAARAKKKAADAAPAAAPDAAPAALPAEGSTS